MKRPGKVVKPRKAKKTHKVKKPLTKEAVSVGDLNWKPVEIPDTLDDYEGFYGLEEIDGVDVKVVNGQVQFLTSEGKTSNEAPDLEMADDDEMEHIDHIDTKMGDGEVSLDAEKAEAVKKGEDEDENAKKSEEGEIESEKEEKRAEKKKTLQDEEKRKAKDRTDTHNPFESLEQLPEETELPKWNLETPLSSYTILGLSQNGFTDPTPIQKKTIPLAVNGHDIIGKAITGSGKTLAYGIPILEKAYSQANTQSGKDSPPVGIIFTPTRELAKQVSGHLQALVKHSPFKKNDIMLLTGGLAAQKQERLLNLGPKVIVATPGRFLEFLEASTAFTERMASLDILVLDEADRLLQDGHFEELEKIIELLGKNRPRHPSISRRWQTLVFSATFSLDLFGKLDKRIRHEADGNEAVINLLQHKLRFKEKPAFIDVNPKESVSGFVSEALIECGAVERDLYLYYFLMMYPGTTLVFANSISSVRRLVPLLNNLQIPTFALHSQLDQQHRFKALEKFKAECTKQQNGSQKPVVMVASDVAARGLDIPSITHVVHYHLPRSADFYIHRSGRTGRASTEGVAIMLCSPQEASGPLVRLRKLVSEKKGTGYNGRDSIKHLPIEMDLVNQLRPRISLAGELADAQISANAKQKEKSWVQKAADDLGLSDVSDLEEDDVLKRQRKRIEFKSRDKGEIKATRAHLNSMLKQPIRKDARRSYLTGGLSNLADMMLKGQGHQSIIGHENVTALSHVKGKKRTNKTSK